MKVRIFVFYLASFLFVLRFRAAPTTHISNYLPTIEGELEERQASPIAVITGARLTLAIQSRPLIHTDIIDVITFVVSALQLITELATAKKRQAQFTTTMVSDLQKKYPKKNMVVFHNQKSKYNFYGATHTHYELKLAELHVVGIKKGFTQGYEIMVFDYGSFKLSGDGGYENWAMGSCKPITKDKDGTIDFAHC